MIDTHVHFWEYVESRDTWMPENIRRDFMPEDLRPQLIQNAVGGVVAIQADQSERETDFLIGLSHDDSKIVGIIGWIDLLSDQFVENIEKYQNETIVKGWRHIVQDEPKGFLNDPQFIQNVKALGDYNHTYGILVYHYQLPEVLDFLPKLYPDQTLVLNHLAKPDLKKGRSKEWAKNMTALARHKNVYCKLSGLVTEAAKGKWTENEIFYYLDVALENFGIERVMFGSDWPVMTLNSNYCEWIDLIKTYTGQFSEVEQHKILHQNAVNCYNLSGL